MSYFVLFASASAGDISSIGQIFGKAARVSHYRVAASRAIAMEITGGHGPETQFDRAAKADGDLRVSGRVAARGFEVGVPGTAAVAAVRAGAVRWCAAGMARPVLIVADGHVNPFTEPGFDVLRREYRLISADYTSPEYLRALNGIVYVSFRLGGGADCQWKKTPAFLAELEMLRARLNDLGIANRIPAIETLGGQIDRCTLL